MCLVAPAFLCVDQSKLSESSAASPFGLLVSTTRVWECFSDLLGVRVEGAPRNIAHLPYRHGGLGLASAVLSRSAACWAIWADCLPMVKARHSVIAEELLRFSDDQRGGIHVNSASSSRDQLIRMGFLAPTWADVANGTRPRRDDDWEDLPRSSTQGWQHEAAEHSRRSPSGRAHKQQASFSQVTRRMAPHKRAAAARSSTPEGTHHPELTGRFGRALWWSWRVRLAGDGQRKRTPSFAARKSQSSRSSRTIEDERQTELAVEAEVDSRVCRHQSVAQSLLEQKGWNRS